MKKTKSLNKNRIKYFKEIHKSENPNNLDWNFGTAGPELANLIINGIIKKGSDVLAGGMISTANNKFLSEQGYVSELVVIYSYLPKMVGSMATVKVTTLADTNSLCETGLKIRRFSKNDVRIIKKDCVWSNNN